MPTDVAGQAQPTSEYEPGSGLLVEYDDAELSYDGRTYRVTMRHKLFSCGDEPMTWQVRHDRDAFKELWLLFENDQARFPLYPGESTEIVYSYTVSDIKWGSGPSAPCGYPSGT